MRASSWRRHDRPARWHASRGHAKAGHASRGHVEACGHAPEPSGRCARISADEPSYFSKTWISVGDRPTAATFAASWPAAAFGIKRSGCAVLAKNLLVATLVEAAGREGAATARAGAASPRQGRARGWQQRRGRQTEGESRRAHPESSASKAVVWMQLAWLGRSLQRSRPSKKCFGTVALINLHSMWEQGGCCSASSWHDALGGRQGIGAPERLLGQSHGSGRSSRSGQMNTRQISVWRRRAVTSLPASRSVARRGATRLCYAPTALLRPKFASNEGGTRRDAGRHAVRRAVL